MSRVCVCFFFRDNARRSYLRRTYKADVLIVPYVISTVCSAPVCANDWVRVV